MSRDNIDAHLKAVWILLNDWRLDNPKRERHDHVEAAWADACQAMEWIHEDLEAAYHGAADPRPSEER